MKKEIMAAALVAMLAACGSETPSARQEAASASAPTALATQADATLPTMTVHKSPTCPCCAVWVEHVRREGFEVIVNETHEVDPIRQRLGVPAGKGSCHTAEVGGLVIEGHVPAADIKRLLADPGDAKGLVLPGMPIGSPGMESPDGHVEHYVVERINPDGTTSPYAEHGPPRAR